MPEYTFTGLIQHHYPATRDAKGIHLQLVNPGDIRDLEQPPDRQWRETTDEDRAAAKAAELSGASPGEDASEETAEDEPDAETGTEASDPPPVITPPSGPVPAPPAVIPGAQPSIAGVTGSEE